MTTEELYTLYNKHSVICTDSRKATPGSLYFALKGEQFNGNDFAENALESGCSFAIVDDPRYSGKERFILVGDVLTSLQSLAAFHRKKLLIPFIGITGTNGKTTTKELVTAVLSTSFKTIATQGNLNNHIGVPLTILSIPAGTEMAVIEMGANHPGEIASLCEISMPTHGIITNIGKAHLEGFGGYEGVVRTKKELYDYLEKKGGFAFVHSDDALLESISENIYGRIFYGSDNRSQCLVNTMPADPYATVQWIHQKKEIVIQTSLIGIYNAPNIAAAIAVGNYFGIPDGLIRLALESYQPRNNRSEIRKTDRNTLILDAYNANPSSMNAALENFAATGFPNKTVILGDMLELGIESENEHARIVEKIQSLSLVSVFLVGPVFKGIRSDYPRFENAGEALEYFKKNELKDRTILLKGSRGIGLEKIIDAL